MNQELLFSFHELLSTLINQPSRWPDQVANISTLLRQMQHLLNMLRPHQVSCKVQLAATSDQRPVRLCDHMCVTRLA